MSPLLRIRLTRSASLVAAALLSPLLLTQCKTVASYKDVEYDPATLNTPDGHGMEKKDYPFDDNGSYRKDWVKNNTRGRTRTSYDMPEPEPEAPTSPAAAANDGAVLVSSPAAGNGEIVSASGYYGPADGSTTPVLASTMPVTTGASSPEYHRVVTGDTLFSLAQRYGTSVDELKRVNGMTSDGIFTGQSLRIP